MTRIGDNNCRDIFAMLKEHIVTTPNGTQQTKQTRKDTTKRTDKKGNNKTNQHRKTETNTHKKEGQKRDIMGQHAL